MKTVLLAVTLLASIALATPLLDKRYIVTDIVYETVTVTVAASGNWWNWGKPSATPTATNTISVASAAPSTPSASPTDTPSSSAVPTVASTSTPEVSTSTTDGASQATTSLSAYAQPILDQHNIHRYNHSSPALVWDYRLADIAQEIASSCEYAHNIVAGGGGYGQNIGAGAPEDEIDKMITNQMYNDEIGWYPGYGAEPDMTNFEHWGHFSQIVWKSATGVGCFTQHCTGPGALRGVDPNVAPYFTVCNYAGVGKLNSGFHLNMANS